MGYRKDTDKQEHIERCQAIMRHADLAKQTNDRRLMEAAKHLTKSLDDRRKVPWETPIYLGMYDLPDPQIRTYGAFSVKFDRSYSDGMRFLVWKQIAEETADDTGTELIAEVPFAVDFSEHKTVVNMTEAENRAVVIAKALDMVESLG